MFLIDIDPVFKILNSLTRINDFLGRTFSKMYDTFDFQEFEISKKMFGETGWYFSLRVWSNLVSTKIMRITSGSHGHVR